MIVQSSTPSVAAQKPVWHTPELNEVSIASVTENITSPNVDGTFENANNGS